MTEPLQIDFIADGSDDAPLLRIRGSNLQSARELFHAVRGMRDRMSGSVAVQALPGFTGIGDVVLRFEYSDQDLGVQRVDGEDDFVCQLSYEGWSRVEDMLAPFCSRHSSRGGFQWLDETSEISLLFTESGGW